MHALSAQLVDLGASPGVPQDVACYELMLHRWATGQIMVV